MSKSSTLLPPDFGGSSSATASNSVAAGQASPRRPSWVARVALYLLTSMLVGVARLLAWPLILTLAFTWFYPHQTWQIAKFLAGKPQVMDAEAWGSAWEQLQDRVRAILPEAFPSQAATPAVEPPLGDHESVPKQPT